MSDNYYALDIKISYEKDGARMYQNSAGCLLSKVDDGTSYRLDVAGVNKEEVFITLGTRLLANLAIGLDCIENQDYKDVYKTNSLISNFNKHVELLAEDLNKYDRTKSKNEESIL